MSNGWIDDEELKNILGKENIAKNDEEEKEEKQEQLIEQLIGSSQEEEIIEEVEVKPLSLEPFTDISEEGTPISGFEALADIPLDIRVVLGSTEKAIEEILDFKVDSVLKLTKMAGELVEVYVADQAIAKGEIVIVDDKFGILINEILTPNERVKTVKNKLKKQKQ